MKDFLVFTNSNGTEFLLAWNKIMSISFVRAKPEKGTPACAIIRFENAGSIEREFENDAELEKFKKECRLKMSDERFCHSGDPENMALICPLSREKCFGADCAVWIMFTETREIPIGYCGLIRS